MSTHRRPELNDESSSKRNKQAETGTKTTTTTNISHTIHILDVRLYESTTYKHLKYITHSWGFSFRNCCVCDCIGWYREMVFNDGWPTIINNNRKDQSKGTRKKHHHLNRHTYTQNKRIFVQRSCASCYINNWRYNVLRCLFSGFVQFFPSFSYICFFFLRKKSLDSSAQSFCRCDFSYSMDHFESRISSEKPSIPLNTIAEYRLWSFLITFTIPTSYNLRFILFALRYGAWAIVIGMVWQSEYEWRSERERKKKKERNKDETKQFLANQKVFRKCFVGSGSLFHILITLAIDSIVLSEYRKNLNWIP